MSLCLCLRLPQVYASNYALLDLKQLSVHHVMASEHDPMLLQYEAVDMPLAILTEVTSLYANHGVNGTAEALIATGTSTFGSESHPTLGWGTMDETQLLFPRREGWYIQRADKDSAVLAHKGNEDKNTLQCGQRVKISPYNAANASERFGWYFVVDSNRIDHGDEIVDIFVRLKN